MADLSRVGPTAPADGRAQIILVAGFALAVTLVALALVMNAAIYTENLATRGESAGLSTAHTYERATEDAARESFHYAHDVNNGTYAELDANVTDAMATFDRVTTEQEVTTGRVVDVEAETVRGTNVTSPDTGDFTDGAGNTEWTVATGLSQPDDTEARNFTIRVRDASSTLEAPGAGTDEFRVVARGSSDRWYINLTYDSLSGDVVVGVNASGDYDTCTTASDDFEIDVNGGTVDGSDCPALDFGEAPDDYNLRFKNATAVKGRYSLVVNTTETGRTPYTHGAPKAQPALYSMTTQVTYRTDDLRYVTSFRIAPGEGDV